MHTTKNSKPTEIKTIHKPVQQTIGDKPSAGKSKNLDWVRVHGTHPRCSIPIIHEKIVVDVGYYHFYIQVSLLFLFAIGFGVGFLFFVAHRPSIKKDF